MCIGLKLETGKSSVKALIVEARNGLAKINATIVKTIRVPAA